MEASCTTDEAQNVHLAFWINGQPVGEPQIDNDDPLLTGTVGLVVETGEEADVIDAKFNDFIVTRD
jgi:hypothetical protein